MNLEVFNYFNQKFSHKFDDEKIEDLRVKKHYNAFISNTLNNTCKYYDCIWYYLKLKHPIDTKIKILMKNENEKEWFHWEPVKFQFQPPCETLKLYK